MPTLWKYFSSGEVEKRAKLKRADEALDRLNSVRKNHDLFKEGIGDIQKRVFNEGLAKAFPAHDYPKSDSFKHLIATTSVFIETALTNSNYWKEIDSPTNPDNEQYVDWVYETCISLTTSWSIYGGDPIGDYLKELSERVFRVLDLLTPYCVDVPPDTFIEERKPIFDVVPVEDFLNAVLARVDGEFHSNDRAKFDAVVLHRDPLNAMRREFDTAPFKVFFDMTTAFYILNSARMRHELVVAPSGSGKSTLLQHHLVKDLKRVTEDKASVIVMESNVDLIESIRRLPEFASGGSLHGKLIEIDAYDVEYPIALNIFDIGGHDEDLSTADKMTMRATTKEMFEYILVGLLNAEFTTYQRTLFLNCINLMMVIPGATLYTLEEVLRGGVGRYRTYLNEVDKDTRDFFKNHFNQDKGQYARSKTELLSKIETIKANDVLKNIFRSPKTKLNLYEELSEGKVILINAHGDLLKEDGVELFGRLMIALVMVALSKRFLQEPHQRLDTYFYIDEAHDIIKRDRKIARMLEQARKLKLGLILSHQHIDQITDDAVKNSMMANIGINFARGAKNNRLASVMGCDKDFISSMPDFTYALSAPNLKPIPYEVQDFTLRTHRMSESDYEAIREINRAKYCNHMSELDVELQLVAEDSPEYEDDFDPLAGDGEDFS